MRIKREPLGPDLVNMLDRAWVAELATGEQTSLILATMLSGLQFVAGAADWRNWNNGQQIGSFCAVAGTAKETGIDGYIRYLDLSNLEFILF